jgi:hypothetical protein
MQEPDVKGSPAMPFKALRAACLIALLAVPALAQDNAVTVAGTVAAIDAGSISIKSDSGAVEALRLAPNVRVTANQPATLADIKPTDFVASAALRKEDGKLHSTELRIFPEAMRGIGEGQFPMNDPRKQTMTNATVTGTAIAEGSNHLKVKFAGGESELVVDPGVPVIRIVVVGKDAVKPGGKVRVRATKTANGMVAGSITLL